MGVDNADKNDFQHRLRLILRFSEA